MRLDHNYFFSGILKFQGTRTHKAFRNGHPLVLRVVVGFVFRKALVLSSVRPRSCRIKGRYTVSSLGMKVKISGKEKVHSYRNK